MARRNVIISVLVATLLLGMVSVASAAPVKVKFWYSLGGDGQKLITELVDKYNASQSDIFVDASYSGNYYETQQKLLAAIAAGNPPAIAQIMDCSVSMFVEYGALDEITPEIQDKLDVEDFVQTFLGNSYYNDKMWVIPFNRSTPLLYVNQDRLDAAGVEIPQTWQELEDAALKLTTKNAAGEVETFGFQTPVDIWFYEALLWGNDGDYYTDDLSKTLVDAPESVEVAKFWTDLVKKGVMRQPAGKHYMAWDVTTDDFINEKAAMCFLSTGSLEGITASADFNVSAGFMPKNKQFATPMGGAYAGVFAKNDAKVKAAAWEFLRWWTQPEIAGEFARRTGYVTTRTSSVDSPEMQAFFEENAARRVAFEQTPYVCPAPMAPFHYEVRELVQEALQRAVLGMQTPEEAMKQAAAEVTAAMKKR